MDRDREIAELRARLDQLESEKKSAGGQASKARKGGSKGFTVVLWLVGIIVCIAGLGQAFKGPTNSYAPITNVTPVGASSSAPTGAPKPASVAKPPKPPSAWEYDDTKDAMTDKVTHEACTESSDKVRLGFPYGNVGGELCVRSSPKYGLDAYVRLTDDGQILCDISDGCSIWVRFGSRERQSYSGSTAADYSSNVVFFRDAPSIIAGLKTADTTLVQLRFYQAGEQTLTFDTREFHWP